MWLVALMAIVGVGWVLRDSTPASRLIVGHRQRRFAPRLRAAGLALTHAHKGHEGEWIAHYDGRLGPGISAGARLDRDRLTLSAELPIADGRQDLPATTHDQPAPPSVDNASAALIFGHPGRRETLAGFLDIAALPSWYVPGISPPLRQVGVAQSALTLHMRLPSNSGPADVGHALERLARAARACREGLERPIAAQLVEAALDHRLPGMLRRSAARRLVLQHGNSPEARRVARTVADDMDPTVALAAALALDEPERVMDVIAAVPGGAIVPGPQRSLWEVGLDRARAMIEPDAARRLVARIDAPLTRLDWLEALLRGGYDAPARYAVAHDPSPAVRAGLIPRLAARARRGGRFDPTVEALLLDALGGPEPVDDAAAEALAAFGGTTALGPLRGWLERAPARVPPPTRLKGIVEAGVDRIRGALDPALAGQLTMVEHGGGELSLGAGDGRLSTPEGDG